MCKVTFGIITLLGSLILFHTISNSKAQISYDVEVDDNARIIPGVNNPIRRWYCRTFCNYSRLFFGTKCARKCPQTPIIVVTPSVNSPLYPYKTTAQDGTVKNNVTLKTTTVSNRDHTNLMVSLKDSVPSAKDSMSSTKDSISSAKDSRSSTKVTMSSSKDSMSSTKDSISSTKDSRSSTKDSMSSTDDSISSTKA